MDWNRSKRSSFSVGSYKPKNYNEYDRFTQLHSPQQQHPLSQSSSSAAASSNLLPIRSGYYETHWPLFAADWSSRHETTSGTETIAISTYREDAINKIEILDVSNSIVEHVNGITTNDGLNFNKISESNVQLPITNLKWDPTGAERLITTNDRLKIWEIDYNNQLVERLNLINGVQHNHNGHHGNSNKPLSLPPLTSFDWNKIKPNIIITSSIDTTCTVWDILHPSSPKTQLIAHDSEVFDVEFIKNSAEIFASVGNDGSMRVFDLRSLEHSTIIYEPSSTNTNSSISTTSSSSSSTLNSISPNIGIAGINNSQSNALLRLATSNVDPNIIATFSAKSDSIIILDMRYPGVPTNVLTGHNGSVNSIEWHPTQAKLLSGGDDCQAFIWDFTQGKHQQQLQHHHNSMIQNNTTNNSTISGSNNNIGKGSNTGNVIEYPDFAYNDTLEINNTVWNSQGDWFGVVSGKGFQAVRS